MKPRTAAPFLLLLAASGCFSTTVRSGLPPGDAPDAYEDRWHSGWALGVAEGGDPYPLAEICPDGWAEVSTTTNPVQGLVSLITYGIYAPQSVTVVCAAVRPPHPPPREGEAPSAPSASPQYPPPRSRSYPPPPPRPDDF
jgi:hypothetical protein